MNKKYLVTSLLVFIFSLLVFITWNALRINREFVILFNDDLQFCFVVDDGYKYEITSDSIIYSGGKNSGHLKLIKANLSDDITKVPMNGFKSGYKKIRNQRIYEYELAKGYIFRDTFTNAGQMPVNLVPYGEQCRKIKSNFKKHIEIFQGVGK